MRQGFQYFRGGNRIVKADLHIHSTVSDGSESIEQIIDQRVLNFGAVFFDATIYLLVSFILTQHEQLTKNSKSITMNSGIF
jgi:hypothetical protein